MASVHVILLLFVLHWNSFIHILLNTTDVLPADVYVWNILLWFNTASQTLLVYFFLCLLKGHSAWSAYFTIDMKKSQSVSALHVYLIGVNVVGSSGLCWICLFFIKSLLASLQKPDFSAVSVHSGTTCMHIQTHKNTDLCILVFSEIQKYCRSNCSLSPTTTPLGLVLFWVTVDVWPILFCFTPANQLCSVSQDTW